MVRTGMDPAAPFAFAHRALWAAVKPEIMVFWAAQHLVTFLIPFSGAVCAFNARGVARFQLRAT